MTISNKRLAIFEELERAKSAMAAARLLARNDLLNDAVSRLYYFVLYHIRALLITIDLEPNSHEGALRLFGLHFVKNGPLPPEFSHLFSRLMKYRDEADYNPSYIFEQSDVDGLIDEAVVIAKRITEVIAEAGFPLHSS